MRSSPTTSRRSRRSSRVSEAAMLVVAGGALALLRTELPEVASDVLELAVAA